MKLEQIENEALNLDEDERAELAQKLLLSLEAPDENNIKENWLKEAQHRARAIDEGTVEAISADEVRQKASALLR